MPAAQRSRNLAHSLPTTAQSPGQRIPGSSLGGGENRHSGGNNGAGPSTSKWVPIAAYALKAAPTASAAWARPYERDQADGQRRRVSCPTSRSSSPTRWRRAAFSAWSWASSAACAAARAWRQRAMRQRREQTRGERRPARGWPQTSHRLAASGVRTAPGVTFEAGAWNDSRGRRRERGRGRAATTPAIGLSAGGGEAAESQASMGPTGGRHAAGPLSLVAPGGVGMPQLAAFCRFRTTPD
jgi:hypothetical protein